MDQMAALDVLRTYPHDVVVADLYDRDEEFSSALNYLFRGTFEYPDFSHRTVGAVIQLGLEASQDKLVIDAVATRTIDDKYAESIIGDRAGDYDALEVHGVRDRNTTPGDLAGTNFEIDDENPQSFSVYVHLVEGGVDCVGDFSDHKTAAGYAADLSKVHGWAVTDFTRAGAELESSYVRAEGIAKEHGIFEHVDFRVDQKLAGKVVGIADQHIVLSDGKLAMIVPDLNRSFLIGDDVEILVQDGKASVRVEQDIKQSCMDAEILAKEKGAFNYADLKVACPIIGRVMGVTDEHVVLSLGRSATILEKSDLSRVPAKGEDVTIAVKGGKAIVADQRAKEVDRGR